MPHQLKAAIFDWAGTIIDHGSRAPIITFMELFASADIAISVQDIRGPMGLEKREHLRTLLNLPQVARQWVHRHGHAPDEEDLDRMFERFLPIQSRVLPEHCDVIDGAAGAIQQCQSRGLKIGSCTGYSADVMRRVMASAARDGLIVETVVCPQDVGGGRPLPWMIFENMRRLGVFPPSAVVKIDDTPAGVQEARNAGAWAVGIVATGNCLGLSAEELAKLSDQERRSRTQAAGKCLKDAGAHFLADTVRTVPEIVDQINDALARGERPM